MKVKENSVKHKHVFIGLANMRLQVSSLTVPFLHVDCGQVVCTCVSVTKQYNLALVKE